MLGNKQAQKSCHVSYPERKKYIAHQNKFAEVMIL